MAETRIFIHCPDDEASTYYRCTAPLKFCRPILREAGIELVGGATLVPQDLSSYDIFVFRSICQPEFIPKLYELKRHAKIVISLDDWLAGIPDTNPVSDRVNAQVLGALNESLLLADHILVTTERLKLQLGYPHKTIVAPNLVDMNQFFLRDHSVNAFDPIRIAWAGSITHFDDLLLVGHLPEQCPDLQFVFWGDLPNQLARFTIRPGRRVATLNPPDLPNVYYAEPVPFSHYFSCLPQLNADVAICPLESSTFNECKTAIKYFEFAAQGIPVIASNCLPYSEVITHGENGWLVDDFENLEFLDELIASDVAANGRKNVIRNHSWQSNSAIEKWLKAFSELAA